MFDGRVVHHYIQSGPYGNKVLCYENVQSKFLMNHF